MPVRDSVGVKVTVSLRDLTKPVENYANAAGVSLPDAVRLLVQQGLSSTTEAQISAISIALSQARHWVFEELKKKFAEIQKTLEGQM